MIPQPSSRRKPGPSFLSAILVYLSTFTIAHADPITITTLPVPTFGTTQDLGPLAWRGGIELRSEDTGFGGLSGLALSSDCAKLVAVSDTGHWFTANVQYEEGRLSGVANTQWAPMLDERGKPFASKSEGDAEALSSLGHDRYLVGFERNPRIGLYNLHGDARFHLIPSPKSITEGSNNGELESVGKFSNSPWADHYLAISEENLDQGGNIRGWIWKSWKTTPFSIKRLGDYKVTDAAIEPNGDILILQRSFGSSSPPGMALARIAARDIKANATVEPKLLFEGLSPQYPIDNMEGLSLCRKDGETLLTLVSDNNLSPLQRTLLLQFALE